MRLVQLTNAGGVEYQFQIAEYIENMVDDESINLQTAVAAPHFTPLIGEQNVRKEWERWVEDWNSERRYRYQAYHHHVGRIFIGDTFMDALNIYPFSDRTSFYIS